MDGTEAEVCIAGMACGVPMEAEELSTGRSWDRTEGALAPTPIGETEPTGCVKPDWTGDVD
jgi:hypothetical protein